MWTVRTRRAAPSLTVFTLASLLLFGACSSGSSGGGGSSSSGGGGGGTSFSAPDCSGSTTLVDGTFTDDVPDWIKDNFKCIDASVSGDNVIIKTKNLPPYFSAYYDSSADLYDSAPNMPTTGEYGTSDTYTHRTNPNTISSQEITFTIPMTPLTDPGDFTADFSENTADTGGIAVDGVAIFNAFAAGTDLLSEEAWTLDNNAGHPTSSGIYHYHVEPWQLTDVDADDNPARLIGIALDGLPIYGAHDQANRGDCSSTTCLPTLSDADHDLGDDVGANFHCHATDEFPSGVCHYHVITGWASVTDADIGTGPSKIPAGTNTELRYMVKYFANPEGKGTVDFGSSTASLKRVFRAATLTANALMCGPNGLPLGRAMARK